MDPTLLFQLLASGASGALGLGQLIGGMAMNPERPTYQIPEEIKNMLALRQMNLNGRMAGASQAQRNINQSQSNVVNAYQNTQSNPNAILAGVSASQGQSNRAFNNLATLEAQDYQRRLAGLEAAQRTMAGYRDKAFDINEFQPYMDEDRTKAALIGAGLRNTAGALNSVSQDLGEKQYMETMQQMYGNQQPGQITQPTQQPMPTLNVPDFGFNDQQPQQQSSSNAIGALASNLAFNDWVKQVTGKNATEFSPVQLSQLRIQYGK